MALALLHRGPDFGDIWVHAETGVGLGHRRLSILDLSPGGNQPMISACGRYVIVFNGEIYNYREIRRQLETEFGVTQWRGHSDTEVMLAAISHWGVEKSIKRFNGMFAFGVWDREDRVLYLARDRFGEKPLYYGWVGKDFLFSSELKAFKKYPGWKGEVDRDALVLLLRYGYIPSPFSIYQGIQKLPASSLLKISWNPAEHSFARPEIQEYWSIKTVAKNGIANLSQASENDLVEELEEILSDSVKIRLESDVPLGAFLSGGIDSSTVVSLMQKISPRPVKTFSIGFHEEEYNEAGHAKEIAKHLGTEHHEYFLTPEETLNIIPKIPSIYDEPFADASQIPTFLVSQFARQHVTVCLSGDGGDEFFGGYKRYLWAKYFQKRINRFPAFFTNASAGFVSYIPARVWDRLLSPVKAFLPGELGGSYFGDKLHKIAEIIKGSEKDFFYKSLISHWRQTDNLVVGGTEPLTANWEGLFAPNGLKLLDQMMLTDMFLYLPDDILTKVDRASMAVSLEARVPFLDPRIAEFAWKVPEKMKLHKRSGKMILRQVLYRHVPKEMVERPKMGFGVPIDSWLRGPLKNWGEELLNEERLKTEGYFNPTMIREAWKQHQSGRRNLQFKLWNVLMFQAWLEKNEAE
jgi:asparagine synthase (glutamine-hydrolyzing)